MNVGQQNDQWTSDQLNLTNKNLMYWPAKKKKNKRTKEINSPMSIIGTSWGGSIEVVDPKKKTLVSTRSFLKSTLQSSYGLKVICIQPDFDGSLGPPVPQWSF